MFDFDFGLGEDIDLLRETVRSFAATEIAPARPTSIARNQFPMDLWRKFGDLGLLGITVGADSAAPAWVTSRTSLRWKKSAVPRAAWRFVRRAFEPLRQPDPPLGHAGAEGKVPAVLLRRTWRAGHERTRLRLRRHEHAPARRPHGDRYVLNGNKMWITNGPIADTLVVYATVDPDRRAKGVTAFLVERASRVPRPPRSSTSSACAVRTPANSCSRIAKCPPKTSWHR